MEHIGNEPLAEKNAKHVMVLPGVDADLLIHDDACRFESNVRTHDANAFKGVKHMIVDSMHGRNHKCKKSKLTRAQKARSTGVNTTIAESFNAWIRSANFFLNYLRPSSHRFWVDEFIRFYNLHCIGKIKVSWVRTNGQKRSLAKKRVVKKPAPRT